MSALSDGMLRTELADVFAQRRLLDARLVELAGEVVARSRSELGADGLARRSGYSTPAAMVASIGLTSTTDAARLCRVGTATAPRVALTGELLPPVFPVLAAALSGGAVGVDAAIHIVRELDHTRPRAAVTDLDVAEQELVGFATAATADDVRRLAVSWKTALDPDGIEPREQALVARRSLRRVILPGGMTRYVIDLDPLSAAYLDTAIDAETTATLRRVRFTGHATGTGSAADSADGAPGAAGAAGAAGATDDRPNDPPDAPPGLGPDPRTIRQIGADVIVDLARHVLSCRETSPALAAATVIVRINHDTLTTGAGAATIDGSEQPISVSTARRVAADAHIIPIVLGTQSQVLDLGRAARLFTPAQKLAITDRDGGCAAPGCTSPPTWTEVHHIKWWHRDTGPTNLSNGILLCTRDHHRVHTENWDIRIHDNTVWFTPPDTIDPNRTPIRGGRPPTPHLRQ